MGFLNKKRLNGADENEKRNVGNHLTQIGLKVKEMVTEAHSEFGSNSPMSLEDPDEPSPSPINPITLKHTLRLASRVSISKNPKAEETYFEEYPNSSLLTELGETLEAISVNDFSFSPSPLKLSNLPANLETNPVGQKTSQKSKIEKSKKYQRLIKKKSHGQEFGLKRLKQKNNKGALANKNVEVDNKALDLAAQETIVEFEYQSYNGVVLGSMKDKIQPIGRFEPNISEKIETTPPSFGSNESFCYSRWIRKESIQNFISRYIPRFLIPAFKAIGNLRIRFAIPTKKVEIQQEIKQNKEKVKKKMKHKRK